VSGALSNRLVEDGLLPGLDATIKEYGKLSEQARSEDELATAARTVKSEAMNPIGSSRGREYHHEKCGPK
jgi:hypothetical protein